MINPTYKIKHGGIILTLLLIGSSTTINAKMTPLASKPALVTTTTYPSVLSTSSLETTDIISKDTLVADVIEKAVISRGGDSDVSLAHNLKIGSYFALWYILNVVYNSELCTYYSVLIDVFHYIVYMILYYVFTHFSQHHTSSHQLH